MVLERNQHVELRPTIQQLFDMTQKVARDLITVVQTVPRLGLLATARQLKELEVGVQCAWQLGSCTVCVCKHLQYCSAHRSQTIAAALRSCPSMAEVSAAGPSPGRMFAI